jgi:ribose transport system substrate-binding protein
MNTTAMTLSRKLCCITKNNTNPAYEGARIGVSRIAALTNFDVHHLVPNIPDDISQQMQLIEDAIAMRPDAILLAPAHSSALDKTILKIKDAGIPFIYFVSSSKEVLADVFVGSDNYSLAVSIATYLIKDLGEVGDLVIIKGNDNSPTSLPRTNGFLDAIACYPGIRLIAQESGFYQRQDAKKTFERIMSKHYKIDGILSANDFMALGIIDAMEKVGKQIPIVGVNAMPLAIDAIKEGKLKASAAFDAMKIACISTLAAIHILDGKPVPKQIMLPVDIVDSQNFMDWDLPYHERPLIQLNTLLLDENK